MSGLANDHNRSERDMNLVELRGTWKTFHGVITNQRINLDLKASEVRALLGVNGVWRCSPYKIEENTQQSSQNTSTKRE